MRLLHMADHHLIEGKEAPIDRQRGDVRGEFLFLSRSEDAPRGGADANTMKGNLLIPQLVMRVLHPGQIVGKFP